MSGTLRDACRASLTAAGKTYHYYSLAELAKTYLHWKSCHSH